MTLDTLILNAQSRALYYSNVAAVTLNELLTFIDDFENVNLYDDIQLDTTAVTYTAPAADATAMPSYSDPGAAPSSPTLNTTLVTADAPSFPLPVSITVDNLFLRSAPTSTPPTWSYLDPTLGIDTLVTELGNVSAPVLQSVTFPEISALTLRDVPVAPIPDYDAPFSAQMIRDPVDYQQQLIDQYNSALPELQDYVNNQLTAFINTYLPGYTTAVNEINAKITAGMSGTVLPDQYETAMHTRARGRVEKDYANAEASATLEHAKRGFTAPPGALMSTIAKNRIASAGALAGQATDIYIKRTDVEVQHLQFVLNLSQQNVTGLRGVMLQYMQQVAATQKQALDNANTFIGAATRLFDHVLGRAQFEQELLKGTRDEYQTLLNNAMSRMEGYKLELDAAKTKKDVEMAQVEVLKAQVETSQIEVQRYSAMIDAISRKAAIEELKITDIKAKGDIFKLKTDAVLSEYEAYQAAIEGDKGKLEGQLAKVKLYETQINAELIKIQAVEEQIKTIEQVNNAKIAQYEAQEKAYRLALDKALQAFTSAAETKKIAIQLRGQEFQNSSLDYKTQLEPIITEYQGRVNWVVQEAKLGVDKLNASISASQTSASVAGSMATAALGSLNTMVNGAASLV